MPGPDRPTIEQLRAAKQEAQRRFGQQDGVEGVGIGDGCLRIYVRTQPATHALPEELDGIRVECVEIGTITARPTED
ncbi:hypothetical protein [Nitriliruptor alkaliphilus]|uniref:hypothetical protein n=1 Tax=Nitriliruptor alkaliphilus TaxID=427918 RepID=UPI000698B438|nr:hypothetical protein [Nitriliruptor alkaliphilus]